MSRRILKDGDRIFCTGCYLVYDEKENGVYNWIFDGAEDDYYFMGEVVNWDDDNNYFYIEDDEE